MLSPAISTRAQVPPISASSCIITIMTLTPSHTTTPKIPQTLHPHRAHVCKPELLHMRTPVILITANRGDSANTDHLCSLKPLHTGLALYRCHDTHILYHVHVAVAPSPMGLLPPQRRSPEAGPTPSAPSTAPAPASAWLTLQQQALAVPRQLSLSL